MIQIEDCPTGGRVVGIRRSFVAQGTHTWSASCGEVSSFRGWRASPSFVPLAVRCATCLAQLGFREARVVWLLRPKLPVWSWRLRGSSRDEGSSLLGSVGL